MNNKELAIRMLEAANGYENDARILGSVTHGDSVGAIVLGVLSLEILLKCTRLLDSAQRKTAAGGHRYADIWTDLSQSTQQKVLAEARARAGTTLSDQTIKGLLNDWRRNFELARYPYDLLKDEAEADIAKRGADWLARGGDLDEADFRYHPEELMTLSHGLRAWIEEQLK